MTEAVNNKELVPLGIYKKRYENNDPQEMALRTGFIWDPDRKRFDITFLGKEYLISWPEFDIGEMPSGEILSGEMLSGEISSGEMLPGERPSMEKSSGESGNILSNKEKLLILRHLTEGSFAAGTGKFMTFKEFPGASVYDRQFYGRCIQRLAFSWGRKITEFKSLMENAGAIETGSSEAGFQLELFPKFYIQFLLWSADEEFPPSGQILFSDNFAAGFHPEDLVVASEIILDIIRNMEAL